MKGKIAILAIVLMAAAALVPLAMDDSKESYADDASDSLLGSDGFLTIAAEMPEYDIPTNVTGTVTVPSGSNATLKDDYVLSNGGWIVFESGSQLTFDLMAPNSIVANGSNCGIILKEGAKVFVGASLLGKGISYTASAEDKIYFEGQFDYDVEIKTGSGFGLKLGMRILDTSTIKYDQYVFAFNGDTRISAEVSGSVDLSTFQFNMSADINGKIGEIVATNSHYAGEEYKVTGGEIAMKVDASSNDGGMTISISGGNTLVLEAKGITVGYTDATDMDIETIVKDGDVVTKLSGYSHYDLTISDLVTEDFILEDFSLTGHLDLDDLSADVKMSIGTLTVPYKAKDANGSLTIEDLEIASSMSISNFDSIYEILSLQNLAKMYAYYSEGFDAEDTKAYIEAFMIPAALIYFEDDPMMAGILAAAIASLPDQALMPYGFLCGYFLEVADEKSVNIISEFKRIYDDLGDKSFTEYVNKCVEYLVGVVYDVDDFQIPTTRMNFDITIDRILYTDGFDEAFIEGFELRASEHADATDYTTKVLIGFDAIGADMGHDAGEAVTQIYMGETWIEAGITSDGLYIDIGFDGDMTYRMDTPYPSGPSIDFSAENLSIDLGIEIGSTGFEIAAVIDADEIAYYGDFAFTVQDLYLNNKLYIEFPEAHMAEVYEAVMALYLMVRESPESIGDFFEMLNDARDAVAEIMDVKPEQINIMETLDAKIKKMSYSNVGFSVYDATYAATEKVTASFECGLKGDKQVFEGGFEIGDGTYATYDGEESANQMMVSKVKFGLGYDFDAAKLLLTATGNASAAIASGGDINKVYAIDDMKAEAEIPDGGLMKLTALSGDFSITDFGVVVEFPDIEYDFNEHKIISDEAKIYGFNTNRDMPIGKVSGKAEGVTFHMDGFEFLHVDVDYVEVTMEGIQENSITLKQTLTPNTIVKEIEVDGVFHYELLYNNSTLNMLLDQSHITEYSKYVTKGDGMVLINLFNSEKHALDGTIYVTYLIKTDSANLRLDTTGCAFGYDGSRMTLKALPHFTLDPMSYDGFTINDDGTVVPAIGATILSASARGEEFTLTYNGVSQEVRFMSTVSMPVGEGTVAIIDEDGNSYGTITDGTWVYRYDFVGDLEVKSVMASKISVAKDTKVISDSDAVYFDGPEGDYDYVQVQLKSGNSAVFYSGDVMDVGTVKVSIVPLGDNAYAIDSNADFIIWMPVESDDAVLYHVVNGQKERMVGVIAYEDGQKYLVCSLTSFSKFILDDDASKDKDYMYLAALAVVIIVALALCVPLYMKKRKTA